MIIMMHRKFASGEFLWTPVDLDDDAQDHDDDDVTAVEMHCSVDQTSHPSNCSPEEDDDDDDDDGDSRSHRRHHHGDDGCGPRERLLHSHQVTPHKLSSSSASLVLSSPSPLSSPSSSKESATALLVPDRGSSKQ